MPKRTDADVQAEIDRARADAAASRRLAATYPDYAAHNEREARRRDEYADRLERQR